MVQSFKSDIQHLQHQFVDSLPQRAHQLENLWHQLRYINWSEQGFKTLQLLVHRLLGSGSSFGIPEISTTAQLLDSYLLDHQAIGHELGGIEYEMIDQMINALVRTLTHFNQSETLSQTIPPPEEGHGKLVFVVEADHALSALMTAYLHTAGFSVQHFDSPNLCIQQLNLQSPHAILIDPGIVDDGNLGFEAIAQIKSRVMQGIPILFMSARSDMHTRLRALRAGCATYIKKPIDFSSLMKTLIQSIESNEVSHKVMIVDDEESVAGYHSAILRHAGMEVIYCTQPMQSLKLAAEFKPDLVILDMHMPEINGIELATLLRQDEQFLLLPIIFVTADTSVKLRQSIESIGVNAILTKPVDLGALVNACERAINDTFSLKHRIETITQKAQHNNQITRSYFFAAIDNELQEDHSHKTPTALYYIGLDIEENFYEKFGPTGVATLHEQFCQQLEKIIGSEEQWSDVSNFVACVLVGKRSREQHLQRVNQIIGHMTNLVYSIGDEAFVIGVNIGIHYLDTETGSANSALLHAENAYEQAKKSKNSLDANSSHNENDASEQVPSFEFTERLPEENLRICYQPMISLEHAYVEHFEALVRWKVNDDELIPAAKFLQYLSHSSMRVELDRWVLQSAINAITTDNYARENACLFIHLADETLAQQSFFSFAANVLRSSRLRGQRRLIFIFEEPWVALNMQQATAIINSLHNIQCGTCLSHTGATQSCEDILQKLEFDYVRLSPSLTANIVNNDQAEIHLNQIVTLAKSSGADVIATQVEDSKNLSTLWIHGIRLFQGFLLQSPDQSIHSQNDMDVLKQFFSKDFG